MRVRFSDQDQLMMSPGRHYEPMRVSASCSRVKLNQDVNGLGGGLANLDERAVLLPRGKLWRVNPMSASGMKQGHRVFRGVSRQEVEKACRRNVSGEVTPR
jgi:hypothetical protein